MGVAFPHFLKQLAVVAAMACLALPAIVHAEGDDVTADAPAKPRVKRHKKPVAPAAATPKTPLPYNSVSPDMAKALTPLTPVPMTADVPLPPVATQVPPPPPAMAAVPRPAQADHGMTPPAEISLKCQTSVTTDQKKKAVSTGTFFIDLFPSPVFPDQHADFKFLLVDPAHKSLIRDSICLDTQCDALVSGSAYYLVNRVTRKGAALRITLNRANGAFYAEEIDKANMVGQGADHLGEQGFCTPQKLPDTLF